MMHEARPTFFEATVIAELPQRLFRLESSAAEGAVVTASLSEDARRRGVHVRTGQRVLVRRASLDPSRGIITGLATSQRRDDGR